MKHAIVPEETCVICGRTMTWFSKFGWVCRVCDKEEKR